MTEPLRHVADRAVVAGFDFSTGAVKGLAFDLDGTAVAEVRLPTDLWTEGGVAELNLMQLEGQARSVVRLLAARLRDLGRLDDWAVVGGPHDRPKVAAGRIPRTFQQRYATSATGRIWVCLMGLGCAVAASGSEISRQPPEVRRAATRRIKDLVALVERQMPDWGKAGNRDKAMAILACLVGTMLLARSVDDAEFSRALRKAARGFLR